MFRFGDYLKASGVLDCARDAHEYKRLREFATALYRLIGNNKEGGFSVTEEELKLIEKIVLFCRRLFSLDIRVPEHIPYAIIGGLADVFFRGLLKGEEIIFASFASNALTSTSKLREKKQYDLPDLLHAALKDASGEISFRWRYEVFLADHDILFPKDQFAQAWDENLAFLRGKTSAPVKFLSELLSAAELEATRVEILSSHSEALESEIQSFAQNTFFVASFKATPERNRFQTLLYASIGLWLERHLNTCVVLDVQKQQYPYEQPYFNRFRKSTLPLFRCAKKGKKVVEPDED